MPKQESERLVRNPEPQSIFKEIGGSPVPGLTLRHVLQGHTGQIGRIAWSRDGRYLASPSEDKTIRIWDVQQGECVAILEGHKSTVIAVAWSPENYQLASSSSDGTIRIWSVDKQSAKCDVVVNKHAKTFAETFSVDWAPDGQAIAFSPREQPIQIFDINKNKTVHVVDGTRFTLHLKYSPDTKLLATISQSDSGQIKLWNTRTWKSHGKFINKGLLGYFLDWSPKGEMLAISFGAKIEIRKIQSKESISLEGHTGRVRHMSFSFDGSLLASKADDQSVRIWRCDNWETVCIFSEEQDTYWAQGGIAFHPQLPQLATLGGKDFGIRIWDIDHTVLIGNKLTEGAVHYTTAKLVLVGDSGVGKTALGWRLAHDEFKEHSSTHGQQFWPIQKLGLKRKDGTECEAVLWDLAGQHVYRQIHSIFLENVAAALVLFDPSNRQEPLKGVQFWLEQLKGKGQLPPAVLVGGRVDRGAPAISQQELEQFCQRYGIRGGYISTSAKSNEGLEALLDILNAQIPWNEMTATVTTVTFKRIKDYVLTLKEKPDRKGVLVSPFELREQLQATDHNWNFTDAEMMTAVGHLETHGYVAVLRSSAGEQHILLTPELLVTLAASIVLLADKHPRELGAISESELLQGKFQFEELTGLSQSEAQILLDAAILRFLEHNICFRETFGNENLLIFPGLIKQKRPLQDDLPSTDDVSYVVRGRVENLYASLVVLLGYTPSFTRINQWQNQAQYEMREGEICGFRLIEDRQGEIELVLYHGDCMQASGRDKFQELFEQFLHQRDVEVTRFPPVICTNGHQQKRATVVDRVREHKPFMFCDECGDKITLPDFDKPQIIGISASPWLQREEAVAHLRSAYEVQLTKVKGYRRDWAMPRCYISHVDEQSDSAKDLIKDLRDAGVYVVEQAAQIQPNDFIIVLDTPAYQKAFKSRAAWLAADIPFVNMRLGKRQLISLAFKGQSGPHEFRNCELGSFCDETHYPVSLFDLVLTQYAIPLTHAGFEPLRQALHMQWEQTLARTEPEDHTSPLKIFISYSHKDENFKDELVTMLKGLQRRGIVDTWQDRGIEPGDEWYKSIQDAMDECDLALLLVSPDYIASDFIQEEEQPKLLQRRVIPIILRPCPWQSEPVLKDLQVLPKDGKPIITFSDSTGERDQVWTDIADVIEERAKKRN